MLETNELKINYFTYLIYIKQKSDIFKGYLIWDNKFLNLKNKLAVQLLYNHRPCLGIPALVPIYCIIMLIKTDKKLTYGICSLVGLVFVITYYALFIRGL